MAKIIITRKKATGGAAQSHDVFLVNQYIGELKNGGTIEVPVDVGTYLLTFNSKKSFGQNATFTCVVNYPNEIVEIQTKVSFNGDYVVEYADNAPHIPVANTINVNPQDVNQSTFVNSAPIVHPKKKKSKGLTITIVVLAFIFLYGILYGLSSAINGESDTAVSGASSASSSQESEPEIKYIEVTANDLWNAFDDNEVAAEEKYNGKPVKITGVISEINSAGTLTSANILLKADGAFLGCVQCSFNSSENAKALANLQKGQSVTITGTCGKLSITNVMVTGCEVVN